DGRAGRRAGPVRRVERGAGLRDPRGRPDGRRRRGDGGAGLIQRLGGPGDPVHPRRLRPMDEREVFVLANRTLNGVVAQIGDDRWAMPMPPNFRRRATDEPPTLRQIIGYHAYDDAWVPDMLAGLTMDEAGRDKFDGDLLGDDPRGRFA